MSQQFYTTAQVATICGMCPTTVRRMADSGKLRAWAFPGSTRRRVSRYDLIEFLANQQLWGALWGMGHALRIMIAGVPKDLGLDLAPLCPFGSLWPRCWVEAGDMFEMQQPPAAIIGLNDFSAAVRCTQRLRHVSPGRTIIGVSPPCQLSETTRALFDRVVEDPIEAKALVSSVPFHDFTGLLGHRSS